MEAVVFVVIRPHKPHYSLHQRHRSLQRWRPTTTFGGTVIVDAVIQFVIVVVVVIRLHELHHSLASATSQSIHAGGRYDVLADT